ncbi:hypothetical protein CL619_03880 [archaeon]|nr:hypothetical protein [archaeon]|tara:strand:- start:768 stop:1049 length:282 start_codon:yes stop_codon:yes gene_type:complete
MKILRYLFLSIAIISLLLVGCSSKPDAKVIECSNIFFNCNDNNCENQCGKIATEKGKVLTGSESVNDGSGCWCEYEDPESKIIEEEKKENNTE